MKKFNSYDNWINEKFIEDSDPIHDMGIGINRPRNFKNEAEQARWIVRHLHHILGTKEIPDDIIRSKDVFILDEYYNKIKKYALEYHTIQNKKLWCGFEPYDVQRLLRRRGFRVNVPKKRMNEKFIEDSDPIHDLGIGIPFVRIQVGDIVKTLKPINTNLSHTRTSEQQLIFDPKEKIGHTYEVTLYCAVIEVIKKKKTIKIIMVPFGHINLARICKEKYFEGEDMKNHTSWIGETDLLTWSKHFEIIKNQ